MPRTLMFLDLDAVQNNQTFDTGMGVRRWDGSYFPRLTMPASCSQNLSDVTSDHANFTRCVAFNGSGTIKQQLTVSGEFTVAAWVKLGSVLDTTLLRFIRGTYQNNGTPMLSFDNGKPTLWNGAASTTAWTTDTWHHLAVTQNASGSLLYVDGTATSTTPAARVATGGKKLYIGEDFRGKLAQLGIYDGALTATAIARIKDKGRYQKPTLYLPLDSISVTGAVTGSGTAYNATINTNSTSLGPPIRTQCSMAFDGSSSYVSVSSVTCPASFTIAAWVKLDTTLSATGYATIVKFGSGPRFSVTNRYLNLDGTNNATRQLDWGWHHVAATYGASACKLYVDGVEVGSSTKTLTIGTTASAFTLGKDGTSSHFKGEMADVRVYNEALSAEMIPLIM